MQLVARRLRRNRSILLLRNSAMRAYHPLRSTLRALRLLLVVAAFAALAAPAPAAAYDDAAFSAAGPKAKLKGANLAGANLAGANLQGAKLEKANLAGANLQGADLRKADLGKADLAGANLQGADLSTAKLGKANLSGTRYDDTTRWPKKFKIPGDATKVGGGAAPAAAAPAAAAPAAAAPAAGGTHTLTPADVVAVVNRAAPQFSACFQSSDLRGSVNMHWKITSNGTASDVVIADPALATSPGAACVRDVVAALTFPAHNKPVVPINNFPIKAP
jgi:hypothetical protein